MRQWKKISEGFAELAIAQSLISEFGSNLGAADVLFPPTRHSAKDVLKVVPLLRQRVRTAHGTLLVRLRLYQTRRRHFFQAIGEDVGGDALVRRKQFFERMAPSQQVAHHEQRPLVADQVERAGAWAIRAVVTR